MCSYMSGRTKYPIPLPQGWAVKTWGGCRSRSSFHVPIGWEQQGKKYAAFFLANKTKTLFQLLRFSLWPNYDRAGNDLIVWALIKHNTCKHAKGKHAITRNYRGDVQLSQSASAVKLTGASTQDKISSYFSANKVRIARSPEFCHETPSAAMKYSSESWQICPQRTRFLMQ